MRENIRTGIDILDINRIKNILNTNKQSFLNKVFTEKEISHIEETGSKASKVAGIFAAKESVSKLLASGIGDLNWKDIEIDYQESGKPYIKLNNKIKERLRAMNINNMDISISHEKNYAIAIAVGLKASEEREDQLEKSVINEMPIIFKSMLEKRNSNTHKGSYGRVAVIAGSIGMTGAPFMACQSALRTGSGLVYSIVPRSIEQIMCIKLTEVIVKSAEDNSKGYFTPDSLEDILNNIENMDAIAIGPGIGVDRYRLEILEEIINKYNKPIILDADAINCLSIKPHILYNRNKEIIITPHPGELARLLDKSIEEIQANRIFYAKYASEKYNIIVVLKGANTIVADPSDNEVYINQTGNPGMATAASGDVLTGMILSFIGQGRSPVDASKLAVYVHGLAGDIASIDKGEYSLIASDIIDNISNAIKVIQN